MRSPCAFLLVVISYVANVRLVVVVVSPLIVSRQVCTLKRGPVGAGDSGYTCARWSISLLEVESPVPRRENLASLRARFLRGDARPGDFDDLTSILGVEA